MKYRHLVCGLGLFIAVATSAIAGQAEKFVVLVDPAAGALVASAQFVNATGDASASREARLGVSLIEEFRGQSETYLVLAAPNRSALTTYLDEMKVSPRQVETVQFVNSPVVGGGAAAGKAPRPGHQVYLIERKVPGAGDFPIEKKKKISKGSNAAIAKLNKSVEWDHSYLTPAGTFCAYRAIDKEKILEHARLAGIPANKVTPVMHIFHDHNFGKQSK